MTGNAEILKRGKLEFIFLLSMLTVGTGIAGEPNWNPADAAKDAEKDIKAQHIQFYWSGSISVFPVGVPFDFAKQYPRADAGVGCVTNDIPLREKQEKCARFYNETMYDFVSKNPEIGKLK